MCLVVLSRGLSRHTFAPSIQVLVGHWSCDAAGCGRRVEYNGRSDGIFSFRRRNRAKRWLLFTRGVIDKLQSFTISARTTYTAATRHLVADVASFNLRRQDVVKLGTMAARSFFIPPETAQFPICGPDPEFIVIDAQAIGCTDPDDVHAFRPGEDCPVLPIEASKLCILEQAALRAAVDKVLRGCKALTEPRERVLRTWHQLSIFAGQPSPAAAAALLFFRFFPLEPSSGQQGRAPPATGTGLNEDGDVDSGSSTDPHETFTSRQARKKFDEGRTLEDAVKEDADGSLVLGGAGKAPQPVQETWRDRTGVCAPNFSHYSRNDDGFWVCILPFLQAILAETPTGMFQAHDEKTVGLFADALRFKGREYWRSVTKAEDGVGFITSFIGLLGDELDADAIFRDSVGVLLRQAVDVEVFVDDEFKRLASKRKADRG